jgi:N-acetylglucosaminyldiphosphoundecaprenol N-acetyl-beta-D-mannosaminyltransferase
MKKISILSLHLGYGGIEKSIVSLANVLCEKYDVEIATVYKIYEKPVFDLDKRVKVHYLNPDTIVPNHESL